LDCGEVPGTVAGRFPALIFWRFRLSFREPAGSAWYKQWAALAAQAGSLPDVADKADGATRRDQPMALETWCRR